MVLHMGYLPVAKFYQNDEYDSILERRHS